MKLINKIFNTNNQPPSRIRLSDKNIENWPSFYRLLEKGKVKFDNEGRLRYLHGAPVGDLILVRVKKDGTPEYKESAEEWFDPDSEKARNYKWK
jgi:hypothetical protein